MVLEEAQFKPAETNYTQPGITLPGTTVVSCVLQTELGETQSKLTRSAQEVERLKGELRTANASGGLCPRRTNRSCIPTFIHTGSLLA